ncbi:2256_t:CDS:1 [Racocetra persica]|uniref:2256_t:CDS:1 n=1 Tax=Racocetra persica TaxID=160502 RepID=A0ACA9RAH2_9GLOM|nr:2256_t:CDS:1 [Racocetra persica]
MPQQKTRTNTTLACINCQWRHGRCERLSGEDICTSCKKHNRLCVFIPGNKHEPKSRRQNPGFANPQPFSNINTCIPSIENISNSLHPVSRAPYIQHQLMPDVESYSYLIP